MAEFQFTNQLDPGTSGEDVLNLQKFLNQAGFTVADSGAGSVGNETSFFGPLTQDALQRFQADQGIVTSGDPLSTGFGRLGPQTLQAINSFQFPSTDTSGNVLSTAPSTSVGTISPLPENNFSSVAQPTSTVSSGALNLNPGGDIFEIGPNHRSKYGYIAPGVYYTNGKPTGLNPNTEYVRVADSIDDLSNPNNPYSQVFSQQHTYLKGTSGAGTSRYVYAPNQAGAEIVQSVNDLTPEQREFAGITDGTTPPPVTMTEAQFRANQLNRLRGTSGFSPSGQVAGATTGGFGGSTGSLTFNNFPTTFPSNALTGMTSRNDLMQRVMDAFESQKALQQKFLASLEPGADEIDLQNKLRDLNQGERLGLEKIEGQTVPLEFIVGQQRELQRQTAIDRLGLSENLKALTGRREGKMNALKSAIGFASDNIETILGLDSHFRKMDKEDRGIVRDQITDIIAFADGKSFEQLDRETQNVLRDLASRSSGLTLDLIRTALERGKIAYDEDRALNAEKLASQQALTDKRLGGSGGSGSGGVSPEAQYYIDALLRGDITLDDNLSQIPGDIRGEVLNGLNSALNQGNVLGDNTASTSQWDGFRKALISTANLTLSGGGKSGSLSPLEAKSLGLPSSMIGMSEAEVMQQLFSATPPSWFNEVVGGSTSVPTTTSGGSGTVNLF